MDSTGQLRDIKLPDSSDPAIAAQVQEVQRRQGDFDPDNEDARITRTASNHEVWKVQVLHASRSLVERM